MLGDLQVSFANAPSPSARSAAPMPAAPVPGAVEGSTVEYPGALAGRTLTVTATETGFKDSVILSSAADSGVYRTVFAVPKGLIPRQSAKAALVEFIDRSGKVVATYGGGVAWAAKPGPGAEYENVSSRLVSFDGATVVVENSVDPAWLGVAGRVFPVEIDPTFTIETGAAVDTYVNSDNCFGVYFAQNNNLRVGAPGSGAEDPRCIANPRDRSTTRTLLGFNLWSGYIVSSATLSLNAFSDCPTRWWWQTWTRCEGGEPYRHGDLVVARISEPWNQTETNWANQPSAEFDYPTPYVSAPNGWRAGAKTSIDVTALVQQWSWGVPNYGMMLVADDGSLPGDVFEYNRSNFVNFYPSEAGLSVQPTLSVTYYVPPPPPTPPSAAGALPADGTTVPSLTPTLTSATGSSPSGAVSYQFTIAAGSGPNAGQIVAVSPALGSPSWTVPAGALQDGVVYRWSVAVSDGVYGWVGSSWSSVAKVDLGLGGKSPAPVDSAGPVAVNLATGNVMYSFATHSVAAVAGAAGVSFVYNSQTPDVSGLRGSYFPDPSGTRSFTGLGSQLIRTDPAVNMNWASSGSPVVGSPRFLARWVGQIVPDTSGMWTFGGTFAGSMTVTVNGVKVFDRWTDQTTALPAFDAGGVTLTAGVAVPIVVEYASPASGAGGAITLMGRRVDVADSPPVLIPASWLRQAPSSLPNGWSMAAGGGAAYVSATMSDSSVVVRDVGGSVHTFTATDSPATAWTPPAGEDSVLTRGADGLLNLLGDDGYEYVFNPDGSLKSLTAPTDDRKPASLVFGYTTSPSLRLSTITDPVSTRSISFVYQESGTCPAPPAGFDAWNSPLVAGRLCRIVFWDGTDTRLLYSGGQLARFVEPGNEITDLQFSGDQLVSIRSPLAADAIAAGRLVNDATVRTEIAYDSTARTAKATAVTFPKALPGDTFRSGHTYRYVSSTETWVNMAGVTTASGWSRKVTFDTSARLIADTDALGFTQTRVWDNKDRLLSVTDAAQRMTTWIYDDATGLLTDTYGPAPSSCFNATTRLPSGTCPVVPAHTRTRYDQNMAGLAATFWANKNLASSSVLHQLGVGDATGMLNRNWGAVSPDPSLTAGNWSARYVGQITFPSAGSYTFTLDAPNGVRMYIDDTKYIDDWATTPTASKRTFTYTATAAGQVKRVRVEQFSGSTTAQSVQLSWTPPGGTAVTVPGSVLSPRYGLVTESVTDDTTAGVPSRTVSTAYANPALGIATSSSVDPAGLNLVTTSLFETPGTGYLRRVGRVLPGGSTTSSSGQTVYTYHPATTAVVNPCNITQSFVQGGLLAAAKSPLSAAKQMVYDSAGRVIATRIDGDQWTCYSYDGRGRLTTTVVPAYASDPMRTINRNYAVGGDPFTSSVQETLWTASPNGGTITTTVDLLGRVVSTEDVWGLRTVTTYDVAGRVSQTTGPAGTRGFVYDDASRVVSQSFDGGVIATLSYDASTSEFRSVAFPAASGGNGTSVSTSLSASGQVAGVSVTGPTGATLLSNTVVRSQTGRIVSESIGANNFTYSYDAAGRLVGATAPGRTYAFGFAASGGCGSNPLAGRNGNRTSMTVNGATTTYCYDGADRLTRSSNGAVGTPTYDGRGNTLTLGSGAGLQSYSFDLAGRHTWTRVGTGAGTNTVWYTRDALDRIVERESTSPTQLVRYGMCDGSDSPCVTLDGSNRVIEQFVGLPGGVLLTVRKPVRVPLRVHGFEGSSEGFVGGPSVAVGSDARSGGRGLVVSGEWSASSAELVVLSGPVAGGSVGAAPVVAGSVYRVSAWVRARSVGLPVRVRVGFQGVNGVGLGVVDVGGGVDGAMWSEVSGSVVAPVGAVSMVYGVVWVMPQPSLGQVVVHEHVVDDVRVSGSVVSSSAVGSLTFEGGSSGVVVAGGSGVVSGVGKRSGVGGLVVSVTDVGGVWSVSQSGGFGVVAGSELAVSGWVSRSVGSVGSGVELRLVWLNSAGGVVGSPVVVDRVVPSGGWREVGGGRVVVVPAGVVRVRVVVAGVGGGRGDVWWVDDVVVSRLVPVVRLSIPPLGGHLV
jgi:YD repeat-containing protein